MKPIRGSSARGEPGSGASGRCGGGAGSSCGRREEAAKARGGLSAVKVRDHFDLGIPRESPGAGEMKSRAGRVLLPVAFACFEAAGCRCPQGKTRSRRRGRGPPLPRRSEATPGRRKEMTLRRRAYARRRSRRSCASSVSGEGGLSGRTARSGTRPGPRAVRGRARRRGSRPRRPGPSRRGTPRCRAGSREGAGPCARPSRTE